MEDRRIIIAALHNMVVAESLVKDIDELRKKIGVDRGALIKNWLHERIKQEKSA